MSRGLKKGKEMSHMKMLKNSQWKDPWKKQEWSRLFKDCQGDQVTRAEQGEERKDCLGVELWRGARLHRVLEAMIRTLEVTSQV